ncbi:MAG: ABC transporter ATP-binding protein [Pseudomonadales bacterium]|nr:ABC transporter ATP-binding protein [Pseudomonadales bacterium]
MATLSMATENNNQSTPLLSLRQLSVCIQQDEGIKQVLQDVSFDVQRREILALVGESGSGKSICAQSILGLLPKPSASIVSGEIFLEGKRLDNDLAFLHQIRGKRIAMIFQEPSSALNPVQKIAQQLAEVFQLHQPGMNADDIRAASVELLQAVNIEDAEQKLACFPHQLSGGQCQRVMIAMALASKPDLLIADEPSTALDANTQAQLLALLHSLQQQREMAILFITHDLALVKHWCHRVAVLQQGKLCEIADAHTLFSAPQHPYTRSLLAASSTAPASPAIAVTQGKPALLEARHLHKAFQPPQALLARKKPAVTVLQDISFTLYEQEILALVGQSGCGKSTLGRALLLLDPADSGDIIYQGASISVANTSQLRQLRRDWQMVFQDSNASLNPRHTIERILTEPFEIHGIGDASFRKKQVQQLLERVELPVDCGNRFPHEFSGGQRQRIGIARALALQPKLIICDEALSALDVSTQAQIIALLLRLKQELKLSLLFITHDLAVVQRIADRVLVMHQGRIVETATPQQLFQQPQHEATRALLSAML